MRRPEVEPVAPSIVWSTYLRGPSLATQSIIKPTKAIIPADPSVPFWREFPKSSHPHSAIIAAPLCGFEDILKYDGTGNKLVPAVHLRVRLLGALPLKLTGALVEGNFSTMQIDNEPFTAVALRQGPHDFVGRMGILDVSANIFHTVPGTLLAGHLQTADQLAMQNIFRI